MVTGPVKASKSRIIRESCRQFFCPTQPGLNSCAFLLLLPCSIGLDSGCVYGRRLSALVVPIGNNSSLSSTSPLGKALVVPSTEKLDATSFGEIESSSTPVSSQYETEQVVDSLAREEDAAAEQPSGATSVRGSAARPNSQPNWHGGLNRVKLSPPGSSSVVAGAAADDADKGDSTSKEYSDSNEPTNGAAAKEEEEEEKEETRPWWRPWLRLRREKRAPPQGRPGIAPWESAAILSRDDERTASAVASSTPTTKTTTTAGEGKGSSRFLKKLHTSPSTTSTPRKQNAAAADEDDEEDARIASPSAATKGDKEASSNLLREQQVVLAQAREVNHAWIVSVDCSGELA